MQTFELFDPIIEEYVPVGQLIQIVAPFNSEYVPAVHTVHTDEFVAPSEEEYLPAGHLEHAFFGSESYVPGGQLLDDVKVAYQPE